MKKKRKMVIEHLGDYTITAEFGGVQDLSDPVFSIEDDSQGKSMIYPQVSTEEWCRLNPGLSVKSLECDCGHFVETTVPWTSKEWVGLTSPACSECGEVGTVSTMITKDVKLNREISELRDKKNYK